MCYLLWYVRTTQVKSYDDSCVSSCFTLSTHSCIFQAIHFLPSECAINFDGPCLKGSAYATDTLSVPLRFPLSPACLWLSWWHAWQSWESKALKWEIKLKASTTHTLKKRKDSSCVHFIKQDKICLSITFFPHDRDEMTRLHRMLLKHWLKLCWCVLQIKTRL